MFAGSKKALMLHSVTVTVLLACVVQVHTEEPAANHIFAIRDSAYTVDDKLVDKLIDEFFDRALTTLPLNVVHLDQTTFGKPGQLAIQPRTGLPAVHAFLPRDSTSHFASYQQHFSQSRQTQVRAEEKDAEDKDEGYKFGDFTKGILKAGMDKDYKLGDMTKAVVQKATGNKDYEFGDMTKAAAQDAIDAGKKAKDVITEVGKEVTGDDNYKVGDITKAAAGAAAESAAERAGQDVAKLKQAADAAGKVITEDEGYQFGDVTKGILKGAKGIADKAKEAYNEKKGDGQA